MPDPAMRGVVSISVDADASSSPSTAARDDVLSVVIELLDRFHTHRIAATWAFHDPAGTSLAARRITSDMPGQEVALQVAASDSQGDLSRGEVLRTIVRRLQSAAAAGVSITSLAATGDWNARNIDLLTKQGISIIRAQALATGPASAGARQGIAKLDGDGAHAVCHGLWHVPVSISLHGGGWIANRIQLVRLAHRLNRAARAADCATCGSTPRQWPQATCRTRCAPWTAFCGTSTDCATSTASISKPCVARPSVCCPSGARLPSRYCAPPDGASLVPRLWPLGSHLLSKRRPAQIKQHRPADDHADIHGAAGAGAAERQTQC